MRPQQPAEPYVANTPPVRQGFRTEITGGVMRNRNIRILISWVIATTFGIYCALADEAPRLITVVAEGRATAEAAGIDLLVEVECHDPDLSKTETLAEVARTNLLGLLKAIDVPSKTIDQRTQEANFGSWGDIKDSYYVRRSFWIHLLPDSRRAFEVTKACYRAGAQKVFRYSVRDPKRNIEQEAMIAAISKARARATAMAEELGETVGRVKSISEGMAMASVTREGTVVVAEQSGLFKTDEHTLDCTGYVTVVFELKDGDSQPSVRDDEKPAPQL